MEDEILLYIWVHGHDRLLQEKSLAACLVPPIQRNHAYKQLQEAEEVPKWKDCSSQCWLTDSETLDFTYLVAQHVGIQYFGLTFWKKEVFFFSLSPLAPWALYCGRPWRIFAGFPLPPLPPQYFLISPTFQVMSKQKKPARDIKGFARNVSTEIRFCFCRMILSLTAAVTKISNKHIRFLVMKIQETGDYRSTKGQNWYAFFRAGQSNFRTLLWGRSAVAHEWWAWADIDVENIGHELVKFFFLTLFASQIFYGTLGFLLPPHQFAPSCFTLFSAKNGFAQAGPVLPVWWLPLT